MLIDVLTLTTVRKLADPRSFARGEAYHRAGAVGPLETDDHETRAWVDGTHRYRVRLGVGPDAALEHECTCPVGEEGAFCKHAVALALSWLGNDGDEVLPDAEEVVPPRKARKSHDERLREYAASMDEHRLRARLLEAAGRDPGLRDKLLFEASARAGGSVASLRAAVTQATRTGGFVDWRGAADYAGRLDELARMLDARLGDGDPKFVNLVEYAIERAHKALDHIDDSNGHVMPAIVQLREVHERACALLAPDPEALADRLFRFQTKGEWDTFHSVLPAYGSALGEPGIARYRSLVEAEWKRLPALGPKTDRSRFDGDRFRIEHAMEELCEFRGDIDGLVTVKSHNLSSPRAFLALAELLREHGRDDEALASAERGLSAFPGDRMDALATFCIEAYLRRTDFDRVESLAWQCFETTPTADEYLTLVRIGKKIGREESLAAKAIEHLSTQMREEESPRSPRRYAWQATARSTLVDIHLRRRDAAKAWDVFRGGPVDLRLWDRMAQFRGTTHPDDAVALYRKLLPRVVDAGTPKARYDDAADVVRAMQSLRARQGKLDLFRDELAEIRAAWKSKRNFMKLLDRID